MVGVELLDSPGRFRRPYMSDRNDGRKEVRPCCASWPTRGGEHKLAQRGSDRPQMARMGADEVMGRAFFA
jgi:hypothetical protein